MTKRKLQCFLLIALLYLPQMATAQTRDDGSADLSENGWGFVPSDGSFPNRVSEPQLRLLEKVGCGRTQGVVDVANRMERRGFNAAQFYRACTVVHRYSPGNYEAIESVAVLSLLGFNDRVGGRFIRGDYSMRSLVERKARKTRRAGIIMLLVGMPLVVGSSFLYGAYADAEMGDWDALPRIFGALGITIGGIATSIGTATTIAGGMKLRRETAPPYLLEEGSVEQIDNWNREVRSGETKLESTPKSKILIYPFAQKKGGGLKLSMTF
jgi:hypothetical protein